MYMFYECQIYHCNYIILGYHGNTSSFNSLYTGEDLGESTEVNTVKA
jgi:hypothetical protein